MTTQDNHSTMRTAFLGSGAFGLPTLQALAAGRVGPRDCQLVGIVTQPDKPAGRGKQLAPTPIGDWASATLPGVPLLKPDDVNSPPVLEAIRAWRAEALVIIAFGQKLSPGLVSAPTCNLACNLHASILPRWRGAAPINWTILGGDANAGNSVITIADRMDAGLVLAQSSRPLDLSLTAGELHDALALEGPELIGQVLDSHARGSLRGQSQDESLVTKARKLSRADAWVRFAEPAGACVRRVHGLTPWPGVSVRIVPHGDAGDTPAAPAALAAPELKLLRVGTEERAGSASAEPGTLIDAAGGLVACGDASTLRLLLVQPSGSRAMAWSDYARGAGRGLATGSVVRSCVVPPA